MASAVSRPRRDRPRPVDTAGRGEVVVLQDELIEARPPPPPSDAATYGRHGGYPRGNTGTGSRCSPNVSCDSWVTGWAVRGFRAAAEGRGVWLSRDISNLSSDGDGRMLGSKGKRREREGRLPRFCFVRPLGSYTLPTLSKKDFSFAAGQHGTCSV